MSATEHVSEAAPRTYNDLSLPELITAAEYHRGRLPLLLRADRAASGEGLKHLGAALGAARERLLAHKPRSMAPVAVVARLGRRFERMSLADLVDAAAEQHRRLSLYLLSHTAAATAADRAVTTAYIDHLCTLLTLAQLAVREEGWK